MKIIGGAISIALVALAGCRSTEPVAISAPLPAAELARYTAKGTAKITGQAFLRQRGGGVVTCAGSPVLAMPDIPYFAEALALAKAGKAPTAYGEQAERNKALAHTAICDAQGNFTMTNLPAGQWIVMSRVTWAVGSAGQGGTLVKQGVEARPSQETKVLLTDSDLAGD